MIPITTSTANEKTNADGTVFLPKTLGTNVLWKLLRLLNPSLADDAVVPGHSVAGARPLVSRPSGRTSRQLVGFVVCEGDVPVSDCQAGVTVDVDVRLIWLLDKGADVTGRG